MAPRTSATKGAAPPHVVRRPQTSWCKILGCVLGRERARGMSVRGDTAATIGFSKEDL